MRRSMASPRGRGARSTSPRTWDQARWQCVLHQQPRRRRCGAGLRRSRPRGSLVIDNRRLAPVAIEPRAALAIPDPLGDGLTPVGGGPVAVPFAGAAGAAARTSREPYAGRDPRRGRCLWRQEQPVPRIRGRRWSALQLHPPVKWVATRAEEFLSMQHGRDMRITVELALQRDGLFTGLRVRSVANLGAYLQAARSDRLAGRCSIAGLLRHSQRRRRHRRRADQHDGDRSSAGGRPESVMLIERSSTRQRAR